MEQLRLEVGPEFFQELDSNEQVLKTEIKEINRVIEALFTPQPIYPEQQLEIDL